MDPHWLDFCIKSQADRERLKERGTYNASRLAPRLEEQSRQIREQGKLEAKAGLDVGALKQEYGKRLVCFGNVDVRKLAGTRQEIEFEVRTKVEAGKEDGGYIFHSDHSVPNNVSLEVLEEHGRYD